MSRRARLSVFTIAVLGAALLTTPALSAEATSSGATTPLTAPAAAPVVVDHDDDMLTVPASAVKAAKKAGRSLQSVGSADSATPTVVHTIDVEIEHATDSTSDDKSGWVDPTLSQLTDFVAALNTYWSSESGGTISFVLGQVETGSRGAASCSSSDLIQNVPATAFGGRYNNFAWYGTNRHLLILTAESCDGYPVAGPSGAGLAYIAGPNSGAPNGGGGGVLVDGAGITPSYGIPTALHELGHNLGLLHGDRSVCANTTSGDGPVSSFGFALSSSCSTLEYGDFSDIMGYTVNGATPSVSSPQRILNGFMTDYSSLGQSSGTTTTTVLPLDSSPGVGARALKITDPYNAETYYVEYRTKVGNDATDAEFQNYAPQCYTPNTSDTYAACSMYANSTTGMVRVLRAHHISSSAATPFWGTTVEALVTQPKTVNSSGYLVANADSKVRSTAMSAGSSFTSFDGGLTVTVNSLNASSGADVTVSFAPPQSTVTSLSLDRSGTQVYNSSTTVTATASVAQIAGTFPAGTVTLLDGGATIGSAALGTSGTAAIAVPKTLAVGSHSLTARFTPTSATAYASSTSEAQALTVTPQSVTTSTTLALSKSSQVAGASPATATATVTATSGTPVGSVVFLDGTTTLATVTLSSGTATWSGDSTLAIGSHSITARFDPTSPTAFAPSTSAAKTFTVVAPTATATTLSLSDSAQSYRDGEPVTATATVSTVSGSVPDGAVVFSEGTAVLATVPVDANGSAAWSGSTTLAVGTHSIDARFVPTDTADFAASSATPRDLTVNAATTTTTAVISRDTQTFLGSPATVTATVVAQGGEHPAGAVSFLDGIIPLGTISVGSDGTATWSGSAELDATTHALSVRFTPTSSNYAASVSASTALTVSAAVTSSALSLSVPQITVGATTTVTATATVSKVNGVTPEGSFVFFDNSVELATVAATSGSSHLALGVTTVIGQHPITARFVPSSSNFVGSTTAVSTVTVIPKSTTTIKLKASSVKLKKVMTVTVTVAGTGVIQPTGTLTAYSGSKKLKAYSLKASANGKLVIKLPAFTKKGSVKIKVVYSGSTAVVGSTSTFKTLKVVK